MMFPVILHKHKGVDMLKGNTLPNLYMLYLPSYGVHFSNFGKFLQQPLTYKDILLER